MITVMYKHLSSGTDWQTWRTVVILRLQPQCWCPAEVLAEWLRLWLPQTRVHTGRHTDSHRWMFLRGEDALKVKWRRSKVLLHRRIVFFFAQSVINLSNLDKDRDNVDRRSKNKEQHQEVPQICVPPTHHPCRSQSQVFSQSGCKRWSRIPPRLPPGQTEWLLSRRTAPWESDRHLTAWTGRSHPEDKRKYKII